MLKDWDNAIVTDISLAMYVAPSTGKVVHNDRPFHGFAMNDDTSVKRVYFADGTVLDSGPNELYYLPKGASYRVENIVPGGCWAINFDLLESINERPFNIQFRNPDAILKSFKDATVAWEEKTDMCNAVIRKNVYDVIVKIRKEQQRSYMPDERELLIKPAVDAINRNFTRNELSVKKMAELCNISEAYFRRLFVDKFAVSPKEYIINIRIEHAKRLLESGQFSVSEIAEMCGYFEPCHFSREFSKRTGISPKSYKGRTNRQT